MAFSPPGSTVPSAGQLWLSRPPFLLVAYVIAVYLDFAPPYIEYELLDEDGSSLTEPIVEPLGSRWWTDFQPMVRRDG